VVELLRGFWGQIIGLLNASEDDTHTEQSEEKTKEHKLFKSLLHWSHKLNLSLQAGKAVFVENVPIPDSIKQSYNLASETAQKLYHDVLNFKSNTTATTESIPLIRKSFTTIDHYLKSVFDYVDETYKQLVSSKQTKKSGCKTENTCETTGIKFPITSEVINNLIDVTQNDDEDDEETNIDNDEEPIQGEGSNDSLEDNS